MANLYKRSADIRHFILANVDKHEHDISKLTAEHFGITRQSVNRYLQKLCGENLLTKSGKTQNIAYKLATLQEWRASFSLDPGLAEDVVWTNNIRQIILPVPDNILNIWQYGFTEMFNNIIEHSDGSMATVYIQKNSFYTEMFLHDNGVGIFEKIKTKLNLNDIFQAIFELHKGKLTTDPKNHTGEGIFFTSRMFDSFNICSKGVFFDHENDRDKDLILDHNFNVSGTIVKLRLSNHTTRTVKSVFSKFDSKTDYSFNKTIIPIRLAQYGTDLLISRSQAKRILMRVELFQNVILDFNGVDYIGQAFADEIFRVFSQNHPKIKLLVINTNHEVEKMIKRVKSNINNQTK